MLEVIHARISTGVGSSRASALIDTQAATRTILLDGCRVHTRARTTLEASSPNGGALPHGGVQPSDSPFGGIFATVHVLRRHIPTPEHNLAITFRSTRTPPALSSALSLHSASSASFTASVQAGPVSSIEAILHAAGPVG